MTLVKYVDGVKVPLSEAEIAERQAQEAEWAAGATERYNAEQTRLCREAMINETDPLVYETAAAYKARIARTWARFPLREE